MPIDPSIPLSAVPPPQAGQQSSFGLLGQMMAMREHAQQIQDQQQVEEQRQRTLDDDTVLRDTVAKHSQGPKGLDVDSAVNELNQLGRPHVAQSLQLGALQVRKEQVDQLKTAADTNKTRIETASKMAQGIHDQASFDRIVPQIRNLVGADIAGTLGPTYNADTVKSAIEEGENASDLISAQRLVFDKSKQAFEETQKILADDRTMQEKAPEIVAKWTNVGSGYLALSKSQADWDHGLQLLSHAVQPLPQAVREQITGQFGDTFSPKAVEQARQLGMTQAQKSEESNRNKELQLRQEQIDAMDDAKMGAPAIEIAANGIAHGLSMTDVGVRGQGRNTVSNASAIMKRVAEKFPDLDMASQKAVYQSTKAALQSQTVQSANLDTYESAALANLKVLMGTGKKIIDTGSPLLNKPLRSIDLKALGSEEQAAFNAARMTVAPEFARILQNFGAAGGVVSDSARKEVDAIQAGDYTYNQLFAAAKVLVKDAQNRKEGQSKTMDALRGVLQKAPIEMQQAAGDAPPGQTGSSPAHFPANYKGIVSQGGQQHYVETDGAGKMTVNRVATADDIKKAGGR